MKLMSSDPAERALLDKTARLIELEFSLGINNVRLRRAENAYYRGAKTGAGLQDGQHALVEAAGIVRETREDIERLREEISNEAVA